MAPKNVAVYVRISDDREGQAAGVARQEKDCRALASRRGWKIGAVYRDNDVSAWNGHRRPEYERLLEAIRSRAVDGLIVWHLDRLHRSPRELEDFFTTCDEAKLTNLATVTGDVDLGKHEGRLHARLMGSVAKYESDQKAHRIRRKHLELAAAGKVSGGGSRPFGFERDRVTIRNDEARLIRDASRRILAGDSARAIAREWNAKGIKTTSGHIWRVNTLSRMLKSGRNGGMREHRGQIVAPAVWKAIVPEAEWRRLRAFLANPSRRTNGGCAARSYLLGGFLTCGICGKLLRARPYSHGERAYGCRAAPEGCGGIGILADPLEAHVAEWLFEVLDGPELAKAIAAESRRDRKSDDSADQIDNDEAKLVGLAQDFAEGRIGRAEWLAARDLVQRRLDAAKERVAEHNGTSAVADYAGKTGALRKAWPKLSLDRKRAIVAAVLESVTVKSAKRKDRPHDRAGRAVFDVERLAPVWRF